VRPARRLGRGWAAGASGVALTAVAVAATGCTVGGGSGSAKGSLWVTGCSDNLSSPNFGTPAMPEAYDLQPTFFAGEPIDDLATGAMHKNRLIVRMQRTGLAIQYNDTLYFDVENSYEVARCVRGRIVNGQPDWKQSELRYNQQPVDWCDWTGYAFTDGGTVDAGNDGGPPDASASLDAGALLDAGASLDGGMSVMAQYPKIHLTPDTDLRSSLALLTTCPQANVSADASGGWIELMDFGGAEQSDLAPDLRTPLGTDFVINYGDRLRASFHLELSDAQVISAVENNLPQPDPEIGGTLDGFFDFDLERGQSAQAFP
jgi:hypothetical protein